MLIHRCDRCGKEYGEKPRTTSSFGRYMDDVNSNNDIDIVHISGVHLDEMLFDLCGACRAELTKAVDDFMGKKDGPEGFIIADRQTEVPVSVGPGPTGTMTIEVAEDQDVIQ